MKTRIIKFLVVLCAAFVISSTTGCSVFKPTPSLTSEATVYRSFQDVWTVTRAAYSAHMDRVVRGKVSAADAADVDRAWEAFRGAFKIAAQAAQWDQSQYTPENVRKLADDVLTLIKATL